MNNPNISNPFMPQMQPATAAPAMGQPVPATPVMGQPVPAPRAAAMPMQPAQPQDQFEVDLTNVTNGNNIPSGNYRVRCIDVTQETSKQGNPMFAWTFVIVDGAYAGKEFKYFTAMTPAAIWKVSEVVTALGIGAAGQVVRFSRAQVVNRECVAEIEDDDYNGQTRSVIKSVMTFSDAMAAADNTPF